MITRSAETACELITAKCRAIEILNSLMMTDSVDLHPASILTKEQWRTIFFNLRDGELSRQIRRLCL